MTYLSISTLPGRKLPKLMLGDGNSFRVLATFQSQKTADLFKELIVGKRVELMKEGS